MSETSRNVNHSGLQRCGPIERDILGLAEVDRAFKLPNRTRGTNKDLIEYLKGNKTLVCVFY